jgi:hypothetical protein
MLWLALLHVQLVALEASKMRGLVNTRVGVMHSIGWDPEWEVRQRHAAAAQQCRSAAAE